MRAFRPVTPGFLIQPLVPLYVAWFFFMIRFYLMPWLLGYSVMGMLSFPLEGEIARAIYNSLQLTDAQAVLARPHHLIPRKEADDAQPLLMLDAVAVFGGSHVEAARPAVVLRRGVLGLLAFGPGTAEQEQGQDRGQAEDRRLPGRPKPPPSLPADFRAEFSRAAPCCPPKAHRRHKHQA